MPAYAKSTDFGGVLGKLEVEDEEVRTALEASADQMDQVFNSVLIEEVPIVPANLVKPDDILQATWDLGISRLIEWLRMVNLRLAGHIISTGQSGTGSKVKKDFDMAMEQLEGIRLLKTRVNMVTYLQRKTRVLV